MEQPHRRASSLAVQLSLDCTDHFIGAPVLALQLLFSFDVRLSCGGLVSSSPERPRNDMGGSDLSLREPYRDTVDLLDRPADQRAVAVVVRRAALFFFGGGGIWFA